MGSAMCWCASPAVSNALCRDKLAVFATEFMMTEEWLLGLRIVMKNPLAFFHTRWAKLPTPWSIALLDVVFLYHS